MGQMCFHKQKQEKEAAKACGWKRYLEFEIPFPALTLASSAILPASPLTSQCSLRLWMRKLLDPNSSQKIAGVWEHGMKKEEGLF